MADIYVAIQNQSRVAMSSINGALMVVLVTHDGRFLSQQPVLLRTAMASFLGVPAGDYTIVARHPDLTPTDICRAPAGTPKKDAIAVLSKTGCWERNRPS